MGSNSTKLKKYLVKGDEFHALEVYNKNSSLKSKLNANTIVNNESLDTWMHVAAKNGMINLLKQPLVFIYYLFSDLLQLTHFSRNLITCNDGNPKKLNKQKQNVLHKICDGNNDQIQLECLSLVLQWRDSSNDEKIDVNDKDIHDNTPLHYAAIKNLQECVRVSAKRVDYFFLCFFYKKFISIKRY